MNGNVYIHMPYGKLNVTSDVMNRFSNELAKSIKPYFGTELKFSFIDVPDSDIVKVTIMDNAQYPGHEGSIKDLIKNKFQSYFPSWDVNKIDIKTNYSQFNPKYNPTAESTVIKQPVQKNNDVSSDKSINLKQKKSETSGEFDYEKLSGNYCAQEPRFSFDQVILPQKTLEQINQAIGIIQVESKVFDEWGLRSIIPTASSALSFYGPPGTGKSMAAEAIAQKLGKKILSATYADIESKFHGEGPKMVKAIFMAAERDNAVLFLDESDSLLSKRLTNVSDGSAQAINSMRSQLLISLEHFKGIVIFATNLVVNYDKAFLSRLINIEFTLPNADEREKIWWQHLKTDSIHVPLASDVDIRHLAEEYEFCGREIKASVKSACISAALNNCEEVSQADFVKACDLTREEAIKVMSAKDHTISKQPDISPSQKETLKNAVQNAISKNEN